MPRSAVIDERIVSRHYDPSRMQETETVEIRYADGTVMMERRVVSDDRYYRNRYEMPPIPASFLKEYESKPVSNACNCADKGNVSELKDKIKRMTEDRQKQDKEVETLAAECDNLATEYERVVVALDVMRSRVEYAEEEALRAWEWVERTREAA